MLRKDQFYKDILDGLSLFYKSDFITNIRNTALQFPASGLGNALNRRQTTSKLWLLDSLYESCGGDFDVVHILGGWYGVLGALIRNDSRFAVRRIVSIDVDPECEAIANSLNLEAANDGTFQSVTADIYQLDYRTGDIRGNGHLLPKPDLLINTSCEHLDRFREWYDSIPQGMLMVLQSNDYFSEPEHVNCVETLAEFRRQAPMSEFFFSGDFEFDKYTRFMLIGRK